MNVDFNFFLWANTSSYAKSLCSSKPFRLDPFSWCHGTRYLIGLKKYMLGIQTWIEIESFLNTD